MRPTLTRLAICATLLVLGACRSEPPPPVTGQTATEQREAQPPEAATEPFGGLRVHLRGGTDGRGGGTGPVVVLLHGWGAAGDDLVGMETALGGPPGTRFVFPEAPLSRPRGGRAWWHLDMAARQRALAEGRERDLSGAVPEGLPAARQRVVALLEDLPTRLNVAPEQIVLGGFSQGAMLSMDVALHHEGPLAGVVVWSGTLVSEAQWRARLGSRRGLPVLLSHGRQDRVLPFAASERLATMLREGGLELTFVPFEGGHTIAGEVRQRTAAFLRRTLPSGAPR